MLQRILLKVVVNNDPPFVQATRKYVGELIQACFDVTNSSYSERLSNAAAELLENAQKYSPEGSDLAIKLIRMPTELILRISNFLREEAQAVIRSIRREIRAVWATGDAKDVFRKKVLASLKDPKAKAMLGYAKIRMETGGHVRARLSGTGKLDVTLSLPLVPQPQAQPVL
jgi:hypothetical protein